MHEMRNVVWWVQVLSQQLGLVLTLNPRVVYDTVRHVVSWLQVVFQQNHQVTKWDYEESGPACIHRKCMS